MRARIKHIALVVSNGLRTVAIGLGNLAISWLVIRQRSTEDWGAFVPYLVAISLVAMVLGWGNRELLLRRFSKATTEPGALYYQSIFTRLLLLLPVVIGGVFFFGFTGTTVGLLCWLVAFFLYQSHDAWLTVRKAFKVGVIAELVGIGSIVIALIVQPAFATLNYLIPLYALSFSLRWLILIVGVRPPRWRVANGQLFDLKLYRQALPFLLIGLVGLLSARMDLYVVSFRLEPEHSGAYQVFTGGLTFIRAAAGIIVYTFITDVYRLDKAAFRQQIRRLVTLGLVICIVGVGLLSILLEYGFALHFSFLEYVVAVAYCWPSYWIMLCVIYLYQQQQEKRVIQIGCLVASLNLLLTLSLLGPFGILGGLLAGTVSSSVAAICYLLAFRCQ